MKYLDKLIIKHLNKSYRFSLETYETFRVLEKDGNSSVGLKELYNSVGMIFDVTQDEIIEPMESWFTHQETLLNNRIVDILEKTYVR